VAGKQLAERGHVFVAALLDDPLEREVRQSKRARCAGRLSCVTATFAIANSSISSCHMLWFLYLASQAGVVVTAYEDDATGTMVETAESGGHFVEVVLRPRVTCESGSLRSPARAG
jgi:hypothetical protein